MKNAVLLFLMSLSLFACSSDENGITPANTKELLQAQELIEHNTDNSINASTFSYHNNILAANDQYKFEYADRRVEIFDAQSNGTTPAYVVIYDDNGIINKFESLVDGGEFYIMETFNDDYNNRSYTFGRIKECGNCEERGISYWTDRNGNVYNLYVADQQSVEVFNYNYAFDNNKNPFSQQIHLPQQFLTNPEYFIRVMSCNNITISTRTNYTYDFNDERYPTKIYAKDNLTQETKLSKEISY